MKKNKGYKHYYLVGGILLAVSLVLVIFSLSLTLIFPDNQTIGWISVVAVCICLVVFFFSIYLLKKANFLKLNDKLEKHEK